MNTKTAYPFTEKERTYREYDDAALAFARQDAHGAMLAMAGWNLVAEAWYADDLHTIAAEQKRREEMT